MKAFAAFTLVLVATLAPPTGAREPDAVVVGSKNFTESVILGELTRALIESGGDEVRHRSALGGTRLVFNALVSGEIDAYAEYTGTLSHEILASRSPENEAELRSMLAESGVKMSRSLGFRDNYALGMRREQAERLGIERVSDLRDHPDLVIRFGAEFMERADGWPGLRRHYGLSHQDVRGVEHELAYRGLGAGDVDVTDVYTTDAEIAHYDLRVLADDRSYFPAYEAVLLYRAALEADSPQAVDSMKRLEGAIDVNAMIAMNESVKLEGRPEAEVAAEFLRDRLGVDTTARAESRWRRLARYTLEHVTLVAVSLAAAVLVAVPLGIFAARRPRVGQLVLGAVGIAQTIPALALLVIMIPLLGLGAASAIAALFLYSLLPIVRNTHAGLTGIPGSLRESAEALGLPPAARLRLVEAPLATPSILAGIKTAAVINVGAATLGALIGAGGYGQPILSGIRLDDTSLILEGAIPAAALALGVQWLFEWSERHVVPRGLRISTEP